MLAVWRSRVAGLVVRSCCTLQVLANAPRELLELDMQCPYPLVAIIPSVPATGLALYLLRTAFR